MINQGGPIQTIKVGQIRLTESAMNGQDLKQGCGPSSLVDRVIKAVTKDER